MTLARGVRWLVGVWAAAAVGLPAGVLLGLAGTAALAPRDFPPLVPVRPGTAAAELLAPPRAGASPPARPAAPPQGPRRAAPPTAAVARTAERLLAVHSGFLARERAVSAVLDRYRPTPAHPGRHPTRALLRTLRRAAAAHARARLSLATRPVPPPVASAHAATLRMLERAEAGLRAVAASGRAGDPEFAMRREEHFGRALGEHYAALAALRQVPHRQARAYLVPVERPPPAGAP